MCLKTKNRFFDFPSQMASILVLLFMVLAIGACQSRPESVKTRRNTGQPDWVLNTPVEAGFLYGVGDAEIFGGNDASAVGRAKDMARIELVKQIEVQVSGEVEYEIEELTRNTSSQLTEKVRQRVKNSVPEFKLSQVTAVGSHKDANGKRITAMVRLDVPKELRSLKQQIRVLDERLAGEAEKLSKNTLRGLSALRLIAPALVLSEQRAGLQARYNALEPDRKMAPLLTKEIQSLVRKMYQGIAQLKISVEAEGASADVLSLRTALIAQLTRRGIQISPIDQSDIRIVYSLRVNALSRGETHFAITEGNIWIKDEVGRVVRAIQARAKGASVDPGEAQSRSIVKLSGQLGKALIEVLF